MRGGGVSGLGDVGAHVGRAAQDGEPARRPRRDPAGDPRGCQRAESCVPGVAGVVAPLADRDAVGDLREPVRVRREDVAPDQQLATVDLGQLAQGPDPGEIVVEAPGGQLPRLVEPDVDVGAVGEVGQQLGEEPPDERQGPGGGRLDRAGRPAHAHHHVAVGVHGQVPVGLVEQPAVHVAEAVLVRHQRDVPLAAERVEGLDVLRRVRARVAPHDLVARVGEGVLGVELDVVDLPLGEAIDQRVQRLQRGDLVPGDVDHDPPDREVGPVADRADREPTAVLACQLTQRHARVERARVVGRLDADRVGPHRQRVPLGREAARTDGRGRRGRGHGLGPERHLAGLGQQGHRSSLR